MISVNIKTTNFVAINSECIQDSRLSWAAKGIYSFLKTFSNGIIINTKKIAKFSKDNETKLLSGLQELIELGYIFIENDSYILQDIPSIKNTKVKIIEEKKPKKIKTKKKFNPNSICGKLAFLLLEKIESILPELPQQNMAMWEAIFAKMIFIEGKPQEEIEKVIKYAFNNKFWKKSIINPYILNASYYKIKLQMTESNKNINDDVFEQAKQIGINKINR